MYFDEGIWLAGGKDRICLPPETAGRHGFIAGTSGTGKTYTQKVLAEAFSEMGIPVFLSDMKGDLSGLAMAGQENSDIKKRIEHLQIREFHYMDYPVRFWDIRGERGHPVRATVSEMGPMMLSGLLGLNEIQMGVLNLIFRIADDKGLLLIDVKDLRAMIQHVADHAADFRLSYGGIPTKSIGAILRKLTCLEGRGSTSFFGEPSLDVNDFLKSDENGRGYINILDSVELVYEPALYSAFVLFLLSRIYEALPEYNDCGKPRIIFFIDQVHLLLDEASKIMLKSIGQLMRLISARGAGIYFITDNPGRLPYDILDLLENKIQHALNAVSPAQKRLLRSAADLFPASEDTDIEKAICELDIGEALFSLADTEGRPGNTKRALVLPPQSKAGGIDDKVRKQIIGSSSLNGKYDKCFDRESAYEILAIRERQPYLKAERQVREEGVKRRSARQSPLEKATSAALNAIGREIGRTLVRGILGSLRR